MCERKAIIELMDRGFVENLPITKKLADSPIGKIDSSINEVGDLGVLLLPFCVWFVLDELH